MWTIYKKLNVSPNSYPLVIPIKQYSSDFVLKFKLYSTDGDLDIEAGATTKIRGTKRDGNGFELTGTRIGNTCTFSGTKAQMQQMTAAHGRCVFEIVVENNTRELITANFYLEVQRAAMDAGTVTSESIIEEFADFQSKITAAQTAATSAQAQADRAEAAAESIDFGLDATPTQGSTNAVSSGGVYDALQSAGLSEDAKQALLACFEHVAWVGGNGQSFYNALDTALNGGLPAAYTKVAYLESTGTQYIQTNIVSQIPLEMRAKFMPRNGDEAPMIGAIDRSDTTNSRFFLLGVTNGHESISDIQVANRFGKDYFVDEVYNVSIPWVLTHNPISFNTPTTVISRVEYSGTSGKVNAYISDGTSDNTQELTTPTPLGAPILLFIKPTSMGGVSMRLYYVRFYVNNGLVFYGIPCMRKSDNKPGLYDTVSKTFFTNAGTGEFVTG